MTKFGFVACMLGGIGLAVVMQSCTSAPASASRILFFGDSIGLTGWPTTWVSLTVKQRPRTTYCNSTIVGRPTTAGVTQIDAAIRACTGATDVIVLMGINDLLVLKQNDARKTAERLRQIAATIRAAGLREWILTPTPGTSSPGAITFTREVGSWLKRLNEDGPAYQIIDVGSIFREAEWNRCATDGIHPSGIECRQMMADFVASRLP